MAFTYPTAPIIEALTPPFRVLAKDTITAGYALNFTASSDGVTLADSDSIPADCFALQDGVSGDYIMAALAIRMKVRPTVATGGQATAGVLALSADVATALYLSDTAGKVGTSSGTIAQQVGWITATDECVLVAMSYLTGTNITASGSLSVGTTSTLTGAVTCKDTLTVDGASTLTGNVTASGTLAVTGASTLTGALAINGGATVATGKDLTMVKGNIIFTKGGVQHYVRAVTATDTILVNDDILAVTPAADTVLTLPAVASAGIGKAFTIIHVATTNTIEVDAAGSDKILGVNGTATYVKCTDDKGIDVRFTLRAIAAALWMLEAVSGDVTAA